VNLERPDLSRAFREFIAGGDGVLIGAPGVGKTHLLKQIVRELRAEQQNECLFLPADRMPFESDAHLRDELGTRGDIISFLEQRTQGRRGYLIVDALDAVRGDRPRAFVLGLIRRVLARLSDSWSVVLSMRTYDALRSVELDEIFPPTSEAAPAARYQFPGAVCRHFFVPPLADDEIDAASTQLPWLPGLWDGAHDDLRELLRVPFNLWLLERLFERGAAVEEVSPVHSEVQLLNLFWRQRVRSGPLEPDQRHLASRAAGAMVRQRTLWADTHEVYEAGANAAWLALHSSEVLQDANNEATRVSFAHNVLFDYAASVELLNDDAAALANFLREEPDRALFLRPTLNYFFARLWFTNRIRFWDIFWTLFDANEPQARLVAQVLPPGIVAREARSLDDLEPLLSRLGSDAAHAENAILRVLQALRTHGVANDAVWAAFASRAARRASRVYGWDLARFLAELLEREEQLVRPDPDVDRSVSRGARSLLRLALESHDPGLEHLAAVWLVGVVARTYEVDSADARGLFETILSRITDPNSPVELVYRLADAVEHFWGVDPELAAAVYAATFAYVERSDEPTHVGGIVLALRSNRRQDFETAQYVLIEAAPRFLREQPVMGMRALVQAATNAAIVRERLEADVPEETFQFRGKRVRYRPDSSHIWDATGTVQEEAQKLVEIILAHLADLPAESADLAGAVDVIAENAASAFVWRALLKAGARDAARYTPLFHELLLAQPVLAHPETAPEAAAFLGAAAPLLDDDYLQRVEAVIVELAGRDDERMGHWARRLVAQIPEERLTTDAARRVRSEVLADQEASSNRPLISFSTFSEGYDEERWLRDEGVATDAPTNRRLLEATEHLQQFASQFVNEETIPAAAVTDVIASLDAALALLQTQADAPALLLDTVWARVGDAAAVAARSETLDDRGVAVLRRALLACASGEAPRPVEGADETFNFPAWSPAARNGAAQGIPRLLRHGADDEMLAALRTLARDPAPSVRYLLALELPRLVREHEDSYWALTALYAENERNRVVQQALGHALMAVASLPDRESPVTETLDQLLRRVPLADAGRSLPNEDRLGALVVGLTVVRGNESARGRLDEALREAPPTYLSTLVLHLMHYVDYRRVGNPESRPMAEAALSWLPQIIERIHAALREEAGAAQPDDSDRGERIRELFDVLDRIISRFYFESGVYEGRGGPAATRGEICSFFNAIRPVLRQLAEIAGGADGVGLPARTAHHFIELLRGSLACDPAEVLHLTRLAVDASRGAGYAFDPMAAREVTAVVETTLADHREIARSGQPLDDMMRLLDAFVEAGWPEAQRLVWRLEELFR
jgi:NACHT domain